MEEMIILMHRATISEACLLLKINAYQKVECAGSWGFSEEQRTALTERVSALYLADPDALRCDRIEALSTVYALKCLSDLSGVLITPLQTAEPHDAEKVSLCLNLAGLMMRSLDLYDVAKAYVAQEERARIADEIHDTTLQRLFAIACSLSLLGETQHNLPADENRTQILQIADAVTSTMRELREMIYGRHLVPDRQELFTDKLTRYIDEMKSLSGISINLTMGGDAQPSEEYQKAVLYRIVCEAISNAIHHGKATEVNIRIMCKDNCWFTEISDNGEGFDQHMIDPEGHGLKNMYKMANLLQGQLFIESEINKGTIVKCLLPK